MSRLSCRTYNSRTMTESLRIQEEVATLRAIVRPMRMRTYGLGRADLQRYSPAHAFHIQRHQSTFLPLHCPTTVMGTHPTPTTTTNISHH